MECSYVTWKFSKAAVAALSLGGGWVAGWGGRGAENSCEGGVVEESSFSSRSFARHLSEGVGWVVGGCDRGLPGRVVSRLGVSSSSPLQSVVAEPGAAFPAFPALVCPPLQLEPVDRGWRRLLIGGVTQNQGRLRVKGKPSSPWGCHSVHQHLGRRKAGGRVGRRAWQAWLRSS